MMLYKINILFVLMVAISCSDSAKPTSIDVVAESNEIQVAPEEVTKQEIIVVDSVNIKDRLYSFIFEEECFYSSKYELREKSILYRYFVGAGLLNVEMSSFCGDSINVEFSNQKDIDYLNGKKRILEFEYSDSIVASDYFKGFYKDFISSKRKVDVFFPLKPGFIFLIQSNKIILILINDCGEQDDYLSVKNYIMDNYASSNRLVSRCGLNLEK